MHSIPLRSRQQNTQVECNAPLSNVRYQVEKHNSPAWGGNVPPFAETAWAPDAADFAAAEQEKTRARHMEKGAQLDRFQRDIAQRVATSAREKRGTALRKSQSQKAKHASVAVGARAIGRSNMQAIADQNGGEASMDAAPPNLFTAAEPTPLDLRVHQVAQEASGARQLMLALADGAGAPEEHATSGTAFYTTSGMTSSSSGQPSDDVQASRGEAAPTPQLERPAEA